MNLLESLGLNFGLLVMIMIVLWLISIRIRDVSFIDAFWAYGMAIMASASFVQTKAPGTLAYAIWALTALWGIRLGTHLFLRWRKEGEDARYEKILGKAMSKQGMSFAKAALIRAWALQIPLLFIVCLPAQLGILLAGTDGLGPISIIGAVIAVVGIGFETVGDMQLKAFKADPNNKGKVLALGLTAAAADTVDDILHRVNLPQTVGLSRATVFGGRARVERMELLVYRDNRHVLFF